MTWSVGFRVLWFTLQLLPRQLARVSFLVDRDLLAFHCDEVFAGNDVVAERVTLLSGVVFKQMRKHLGISQVIDRYDLVALQVKHLAESHAADTSETVDCNSNHYI